MNPILARLFEVVDPFAALVAVKLLGIWALWWADMYWLTGLMCAMYVWVINNNLDVIQERNK